MAKVRLDFVSGGLAKMKMRTSARAGSKWMRLLIGIFFLGPAAIVGKAQDYLRSVGIPTFTTGQPVELGLVNVANGNLHLEIPLGSFPQRGSTPLTFSLVYDSRIWFALNGSWSPNNVPMDPYMALPGAWRLVSSAHGYSTVGYTIESGYHCPGAPSNNSTSPIDNYNWTAPDGTIHFFPITTQLSSPNHDSCEVLTGDAFTSDASGYHMYVNLGAAPGTPWNRVIAPDGTQVWPSVEDSNGNFFSIADQTCSFGCYLGNVVDTLGRKPIRLTVNCNNNSNQVCFDVLNSQGSTSQVTVTNGSMNVTTAFGQPGVAEYSGGVWFVQTISLPDGTAYNFGYDSYGELNSITLPTGGQIAYGYTNFQDSFGNINRWVTSRASGGGTWSYTPQVISTCPPGSVNCQQSVTVIKPSGDNGVYTFTLNNGAWNSQVQYYTGTVSASNLLATVNSVWDMSNPCVLFGCIGNAFIQKRTETTTLPVPGGGSITAQKQFFSSSQTGNVTAIQEWKFYPGASPSFPATPDRETDFTYLTASAYTTVNIVNRVLGRTILDSSGNVVAQTNYSYDDPGTLVATTPATGIAQHDDTNYGIGNTVRGNLTQIQVCTVVPSCSSYLATKSTYDTTGQPRTVTDPALNSISFSFADAFYQDNGQNPPQTFSAPQPTNAYLTQITPPLVGSASVGYYYHTGKRAFSRDQNGADVYQHFMDTAGMDRFTHAYSASVNSNRGWVYVTYPTSTEVDTWTYLGSSNTTPSSSCTNCKHDQVFYDQWSRGTTNQLASDPDGTTIATLAYDPSGRIQTASNPYRNTSDPTYGADSLTYDGLDRTVKITHADNKFTQRLFGAAVSGVGGLSSQLCSSTTYGLGYPVLSIDEAGKQMQNWIDGFGRIIEVDEPTSNNSLVQGAVGTCNSYDPLDDLTQTVQGNRTRAYAYDPLQRMISRTTPETKNLTTFFYYRKADGTLCSGDPSAVCRRTDPRNITTTFSYDALNRLLSKTYSDSTPSVNYYYDQAIFNGLTIQNGIGKQTGMSDASGQTAWSYHPLGGVSTERRTIAGITKTISYTYNLDASVASITYPSGRIVNYSYSNAARLLSAIDSNGTVYAVSATYAPPGALASLAHVSTTNGINETYAFNSRLQPTSIRATSSRGTVLDLVYSFVIPPGTTNNGNVQQITDNRFPGRGETIGYDFLNRINSAQSQDSTIGAQDCWGQSFSIDRWANLYAITVTKCSAPPLNLSINGYNQITNTGFQYDNSGNLLNDGSLTYSWNAENQLASAAGVTYTYDGNGLRVRKSNGTLYWRGPNGDVLAETDTSGNTTLNEYVFFGSKRIASIDSTGRPFYYLTDQLGSTRTMSQNDGTLCFDSDYFPYGGENNYSAGCAQNYKFAGYERDVETGLDYAKFRYYNSNLGRFMSVDPICGGTSNPQSLNAYAYVLNNPTNWTDPAGLAPCAEIVLGVRSSPFDPNLLPLTQYAQSVGANLVFPYAGHGIFGSLIQLFGMDLGFKNGAFQAALAGLNGSIDPLGNTAIDVATFSGGAEAFIKTLSYAPRGAFNNIAYVTPGLGAFTSLVKAGNATYVGVGVGLLEKFLYWWSGPVQPGMIVIPNSCHHDTVCAINSIKDKINNMKATCPDPQAYLPGGVAIPLAATGVVQAILAGKPLTPQVTSTLHAGEVVIIIGGIVIFVPISLCDIFDICPPEPPCPFSDDCFFPFPFDETLALTEKSIVAQLKERTESNASLGETGESVKARFPISTLSYERRGVIGICIHAGLNAM